MDTVLVYHSPINWVALGKSFNLLIWFDSNLVGSKLSFNRKFTDM